MAKSVCIFTYAFHLVLVGTIVTNLPSHPGTEPFTNTKLLAASTLTNFNLVIVTLSFPMLPAILLPLITRDGVVPAPIEPGSLWF